MSRALMLCVAFVWSSGAGVAQTRQPGDSWLMQNYRFTGPPAPGEIPQVSPAVAQLQEIQNATLSILRKADFAGDFEAALAAAAQATAGARLIGTITGELKPPGAPAKNPAPPTPAKDEAAPARAPYLVALRDRSIQPASAVWTDRLMLHYVTPQGAHGQVRLELVDWKVSAELNRREK